MKINPLKLVAMLLLLILNVNSQAQTQPTKQISYHNPFAENVHRNCGSDHVAEKLANQNPDYARELEEFQRNLVPMLSEIGTDRALAPIIYVPVVVHVIHNGEAIGVGANLSEAQIQAQIDVLNKAFAAENANYNSTPAQWQAARGVPEIQFCLAIVDPAGNATNGITRHNMAITVDAMGDDNIEDEIKPATTWNSNLYYNIYTLAIPGTTVNGGTTGYAYYPTNSVIGSHLDGSVVDYRWFGGPGFGQSGDGTLTHETGHYLGLPHTFNGLSCGADDGIADTPEIDSSSAYYMPSLNCNTGFPTGPISCGNEHMYVNYMDYINDDDCSTSFTSGQVNVMRAVMEGSALPAGFNYGNRLNLANNALTACTFFNEDAGIIAVASPTAKVCMGGDVTPVVTLQNFGTDALTTVTIRYQVNGGAPTDFLWIDNLGTGGSQEVTLAPFTPPANNYTFEVYTVMPNGSADGQTTNDSTEVTVATIIPTNLPLSEGFEVVDWNPSVNGVFPFNISGDAFEWKRSTDISAFGVGSACAVFDNYNTSGGTNPGGTVDALITSVYDFSGVTGANLSFDVAYARYDDSFFDSLKVYVSTDCGATFDQLIFADGNEGLATAPATTVLFTPISSQWETHNLSLSAFDNQANVTVAFINASGYGNRLFIDNINISTPGSCTISATPNNVALTCNGVCDGIASVVVSDGTGTINYQWGANAGNSTSAQVTGLCAGSYAVTVTDGNMCTAETTVVITEPVALNVSALATHETSVDADDGTATATGSGGNGLISYLWSNGETAATINNLAPGFYTVTVTDSNMCTSTATIEVEEFDCSGFAVTAMTTSVLCFGDQDGTATATADGGTSGYSYVWSNAETTTTISNLPPGDYSVTATDANGCSASTMVSVAEPTEISIAISATPETGFNTNDGTATVSGDGGIGTLTYLWSNAETTSTINNLIPGNYSVTVTDENNCSKVASVFVEEFDCGDFLISISAQDIDCNGNDNGVLTANTTNGTAPISYTWSTGATTQVIENVAPGMYTVTIVDANGCNGGIVVNFTEPDAVSLSISHTNEMAVNANDGTATASATGGIGGFSYEWSNSETSATVSNLAPGTYTVTATDAIGCSNTEQVIIPEFACGIMTLNLSQTGANCFDGQDGAVTSTVSGGDGNYTYAWSNGETTENITALNHGSYVLTVTDGDGCSAIAFTEISQPSMLMLEVEVTNETISGGNDGTALASVSGGTPGYSYLWNNGATTQLISDLSPGTYCLTITDNNLCTTVACGTINAVGCALDISLSKTDAMCFEGNNGSAMVTVNSGTDPITYAWSNGANTASISGLNTGTYSVTVTDGLNCQVIDQFMISEPDQLSLSLNETSPSANGAADGSATAMPMGGTPGYAYAWSNGSNSQSIYNLTAGVYAVTVSDLVGCTVENVVQITDPPVDCSGFSAMLNATSISCFGEDDGAIDISLTGGSSAYTYLWNNGATSPSLSGLTFGMYSVIITDAIDCQIMLNTEIIQPTELTLNISSTSPSGNPINDGMATANPNGGTAPYSFGWSNGATTQTIDDLEAGVYEVTVTDANGCSKIEETQLVSPDVDCEDFEIQIDEVAIICNGFDSGALIGSTTGGTGNVTWSWSNGNATNINTGLIAGVYAVTATDAEGCETNASFTLTEPTAITTSISSTPVSTNGASDGTASVSVMGGVPPYIYLWSNGVTTNMISGVSAGLYQVEITDGLGCLANESVVIGIDGDVCSDFAITEIAVTDVNCFGGFDGGATVSITGGTEPFTYIWSNGAVGASVSGFQQGTYQVTVSDNNDCVAEGEIEVSQPLAGLQAEYGATAESTPGAMDGSAMVTITGGTEPYTYSWGVDGTTQNLENVSAGQYEYVIVDANGCMHTIFINVPGANDECGDFELVSDFGNVSCNGAADGIIVTSATGGIMPFTYEWSNDATESTLFDLEPGTYSVTATDGEGCTASETFVITESPPISLTVASTNETIAQMDGTATATALGGAGNFTYEWSNEESTSNIDNLPPGTYTVTVTDEAGCTAEDEVVIEPFTEFCVGFEGTIESTGIDCNGDMDGTANAQANGGTMPYTFIWSNGSDDPMINNLSGGTYLVTITDANQCVIVLETEVEEFAEMTIEVEAFNGACGIGGSANALITGGTMEYTYLWSNGGTDNTIIDLENGVYMVTATDENGCSVSGEAQIQNETTSLIVASEIEMVSCSGESDGAIDLTIMEGLAPYSFLWDNGETTEDLDGLSGGEYTVLVTDSQNCSYLTTYDLTAPAELVADIDWEPAGSGNNGTAMANVFGGTTPYSYSWSTGSSSSQIDNLGAGEYSVTVTDANGCTTESDVLIGITATNELSTLESLVMTPNPSKGAFILNAEFSRSQDGMIQIYNLIGQKVYTQAFTAQQMILDIDIRNQSAGSYFLVIRTTEGQLTRKLILAK